MKKIKIDQKEYSYESKLQGDSIEVSLEGKKFSFKLSELKGEIFAQGETFWYAMGNQNFLLEKQSKKKSNLSEQGLTSPMPGKILKVLVTLNQEVKANEPLLILEAMKMEHTIKAPYDGVVKKIPFKSGEQVSAGAELIELEKKENHSKE